MQKEKNKKVYEILGKLPLEIRQATYDFLSTYPDEIFEIHLRANSFQSITTKKGVLTLSDKLRFSENTTRPLFVSEKDIYETILLFCDGSFYTHSEEIQKGYIAFGGIRIGICGKVIYENGNIKGFSSYTSLNIVINEVIFVFISS